MGTGHPPAIGDYGLGVDLGTTYTAAALWRDGRAECVPLGTSTMSVPSVLFLREDDVVLVGDAAVRRGIGEPDRVARRFKRRFGDDVPIFLGDREVTPAELAAQLLRFVVDTVAEREGARPAHVTLTHPATWGGHRTALLVEAAEAAGLTDVGLLAEPVAAAAFYANSERLDTGALLAVYDLGGGTFDATVVRKTSTGFAVEGQPLGDLEIGGTDFDQAVMDHVAAVLGAAWRTLDLDDPAVVAALAQVHEHAVAAKELLSSDTDASVPVVLPGIVREVRITRGEFESAIRIPVLRSVDVLAQAIEAAGVTPADIRTALLVGGSSRIPLVSRLIGAQLGLDVGVDAHPKLAVCLGAAMAAGARLEPGTAGAAPGTRPAPDPMEAQRPAAPPPLGEVPAPRPIPEPEVAPTAGGLPGSAAEPEPGADVRGTAPETTATRLSTGGAVTGIAVGDPVGFDVDLARTGITATIDARVVTETAPPPRWSPVVMAHDEPFEVRHTGDRRRGVRTAIAVALLAVALVLALVLLSVRARAATPATTGPGSAVPPGAVATVAGAAPSGTQTFPTTGADG